MKPLDGTATGVVAGAVQLPNEVICSLAEIDFELATS